MFLETNIRKLAFIIVCLPIFTFAENIEVKFDSNNSFTLDVNEDDSILTIKKNIQEITGHPSNEQILSVNLFDVTTEKNYSGYRNFYEPLSSSDEKDLYFIMRTLALKTLIELAKYKSKLEKAGDRIDHIHPLNFLAAIFSDEELKAYIHGIKKRGSWVWDKFISGLSSTLDEEAKLDNLTLDFLENFANRLNIDVQIIKSSADNREWGDFVKILITNIPREGDADRYDM